MMKLGAAARTGALHSRTNLRCRASSLAGTLPAPSTAEPPTLDGLLDTKPTLRPAQQLFVACVAVGAAAMPPASSRRPLGPNAIPLQLVCAAAAALLARYVLLEREWAALGLDVEDIARLGSADGLGGLGSADGLFADVEGRRVHYSRASAAAPAAALCCLHGFGANEGSWRAPGCLRLLALRLDALCVAPDAPGFGLSARGERVEHYRMSASAAQAWAVLERAARAAGLPAEAPRVLVGHSLGALTAVRVAAAQPGRVAALVLVAPAIPGGGRLAALDMEHQAGGARGGAAAELLRLLSPLLLLPLLRAAVRSRVFWQRSLAAVRGDGAPPSPELMAAYRRPSLVRGWDTGMLRFVAARLGGGDSQPAAAELARLCASGVRVIILHGDRDKIVPLSNSRQLAQAVPGAELVVLPGVGHCPQEEAPELFADLLADWWLRV